MITVIISSPYVTRLACTVVTSRLIINKRLIVRYIVYVHVQSIYDIVTTMTLRHVHVIVLSLRVQCHVFQES